MLFEQLFAQSRTSVPVFPFHPGLAQLFLGVKAVSLFLQSQQASKEYRSFSTNLRLNPRRVPAFPMSFPNGIKAPESHSLSDHSF